MLTVAGRSGYIGVARAMNLGSHMILHFPPQRNTMTIHITIDPEKRDGVFGPARALAALEEPIVALHAACEALNARVTVTHDAAPTEATPAPTPRRARRTKAQIEAQIAADKPWDETMVPVRARAAAEHG